MNKKRLRKTILSWVVVVTFVFAFLVATDPTTAQSPKTADKSTNGRSEEIAKLLAVLRDPDLKTTHPEQVVRAIQRLGEMRAIEAIDDLVQLLTLSRRFPWERDDAIIEIQPIIVENRYPAASALFQIGRPALPALVKVVELNSLDSVRSQNAIIAIQDIFRGDLTEGAKYLQHAAEASAGPDSAQRLAQAAAKLRELAAQLTNSKK